MKLLLLRVILLVLLSYQYGLAQSKTVSGTVRSSSDNLPMPGVTIGIKGTTQGATTDGSGAFRITNVPDNATLVFSFIGFKTQELPVGNRTTFDIVLQESAAILNEVVVTASAIEREKKTLGYAVTNVKGEDLVRANESNMLRSLQGRVPGVQISSASGAAGGATRVVIRGAQSFNGNNQPLYVVDGIIVSNNNTTTQIINGNGTNSAAGTGGDLNNGVDITNRAADIDPNNIESVSILKGPAAAALYGSQAASGVIIITTKNRSKNVTDKPQISLNSSVSFENPLRLPQFQNTFAGGFDGIYDLNDGGNVSWGPKIRGQKVADWHTYGLYTLGQLDHPDSVALVARPNNVRNFFQTGVTLNNSFSVRNNNGTSNYVLTVSDVNTKSMIPSTTYRRTAVNVGAGTRFFNNKVSTNLSATFTRSGGDRGVQGQGRSNILQTIYNTPRDIEITDQKDINDPRYNLDGYYLAGFRNNPYWLLENNLLKDNVNRFFGNAQVSYDPVPWLNLTYRIGTDMYSDLRTQKFALGTINTVSGRYVEDNTNFQSLLSDFIVTLNRDLNSDMNLKVILGHNLQDYNSSRGVYDGQPLIVPGFYDLSNASAIVTTRVDQHTRLYGIYGDAQLSYKDYLFLDVTGRNDYSSTLPKKNRSFFYPGASVSFIPTSAFLNLRGSVLSYTKLRANIAQVGKVANAYQINPVFTRTSITDGFQALYQFPLNGIAGFSVGNIRGNPDLRSELTTSWEIGAEAQFFNNRLGLDFTYYNSKSAQQIVNVPISSTSGFLAQTLNAGAMTNKGLEILLTGTPVKASSGFRWDVSLNFTRNRNKVTELYNPLAPVGLGGLSTPGLQARLGEPYGTFFGSKMLRDPEGRIVVNPTTGRPLADPVLQVLGNIQPDFSAGLSNTVSFKGLTFNVLFDTRQGGKFFSQTANLGRFGGFLKETTFNDREPFVYPNSVTQNQDGTFTPNTTIKTSGGFEYWSTLSNFGENTLFDASFVKLREMSLSYALPKSLIGKTPFSTIQVSLIGRNLMLWTPKSQPNVDPEVSSFGTGNSQGYEYLAYPSARSYGASLKIVL
ncbi:SusC/RagA family TonB-linked outer membrane protein [Larkinella terrae]|uniref:SusC/RagA family TonB-linked outer membrane protein n=1 Tax=Larkinella terrae TaxID=2025311 RepID=A0A7K0EU48_9BACT|nr:SusC/RagA family TonB-linked outer membrane protein [Larkinella terrae]MRS65333.1 SusC/RagA family TonB-linked outer membrane protein [Larkinella terrae]